jgi:acyl carrier protein
VTPAEAERLVRELLTLHTGLEPETIELNMGIVEDLGLDSVAAVELVTAIERQTGLEFEAEQMEDVQTVRDLVGRLIEVSLEDPDGTELRRP